MKGCFLLALLSCVGVAAAGLQGHAEEETSLRGAWRRTLADCSKCEVPEDQGGCKCDANCQCIKKNDCAKCEIPEDQGGCKCDANCQCIGSGGSAPSPNPGPVHSSPELTSKLRVQDGRFYYGTQAVFLNGFNVPWIIGKGCDFGEGLGTESLPEFKKTITELTGKGVNSVRTWVFVHGDTVPKFNSDGYVVKTDEKGTLIEDMRSWVQYAATRGVFVFFTLFTTGADPKFPTPPNILGLMRDEAKLDSFIKTVVTPLATALKDQPGLGGYDLLNEPEWAYTFKNFGTEVSLKEVQRFVNRVSAAIKEADPRALVTVGLKTAEHIDEWSNDKLVAAGGQEKGFLDFHSPHAYDSALDKDKSQLLVGGLPVVVGEVFAHWSHEAYQKFYDRHYDGIWAWSAYGAIGHVQRSSYAHEVCSDLKQNGATWGDEGDTYDQVKAAGMILRDKPDTFVHI